MAETTKCTLWKDKFGKVHESEFEAIKSNARTELLREMRDCLGRKIYSGGNLVDVKWPFQAGAVLNLFEMHPHLLPMLQRFVYLHGGEPEALYVEIRPTTEGEE